MLTSLPLTAHAKGFLANGTFRPTSLAGRLSTAPHLTSSSTPVLLRFSLSTGLPQLPDTAGESFPRGLAVRFVLSDDGHKHTDIIGHSVPLFPARTGEEFLGLFRAIGGGEQATQEFLGAHPKAAEFVTAPKRMVGSFARDEFWALNAFKLVDARGKGTFVRYRVRGKEGVDELSLKDVEGKSPTYLHEEVAERLAKAPFELELLAQVAKDGDVTDDVTAYWPDDREVVTLGTITVEALVDDSDHKLAKRTIFDPVPRVRGVEASADPIIETRASVYLLGGRERRAA